MAISIRTPGSWVAANATTQTVTLPTHAAEDMLLVRVAFKHATMPTTVTCGTTGWAKVSTQYNNGTDASGNGTGSVIVAAFWKVATSAAETNPVITYHATVAATPSAAVALSYQCAATETWDTPVGAGGPVGTGTAISSTITSHISTTANDMVDFFHSQGDNNTLTVPTFTQAGLTLNAVSERPATALSSGTSNDIDADGGYRLVNSASGTSTAAAVVTGTATAGDQGSAWTTRLRVHPLVTGSFAANAVIKKTFEPAGWPADAITQKTQAATFFIGNNDGTGGAVIAIASTTYTFTDKKADAVLFKSMVPAGGTKADAVVKKEMSGSAWTVNAVIRKTFEPSFTANAAILKTWATASQTFTANAAILKTLSPTGFTLDAIFLASSGTRTFASDAVILAPSDTRTFAANAVISKTQVGSYLADAIRLATQSLTFLIGDAVDPGGAVIVVAQQTVEGSFTANAVLLKLGAGGLTAGAVITRTFTPTGYLSDAVIRREQAGSFAANAVVSKSQTGSLAVNAVTRKAVTGSLTSDAIRLRTFYFGSGPDPR